MENLRVRDLMTRGVFAVLPDDDLLPLSQLMGGWEVRHAPVVDESKTVLGVVSHRDLLKKTLLGFEGASEEKIEENLRGLRIKEVMSPNVETVQPEDSIPEAARKIFDGKYGCLLVVDESMRLQGILTESDFVRYFAEKRGGRALRRAGRRGLVRGGLLGGLLGTLVGFLFAPAEGEETRGTLERMVGREEDPTAA